MKTIIAAIARERAHQDVVHGTIEQHPHEVGGWLTIMRRELREAEDAWQGPHGDEDALRKILGVVAVGVACLEQYEKCAPLDRKVKETLDFSGGD